MYYVSVALGKKIKCDNAEGIRLLSNNETNSKVISWHISFKAN